MTVRQSIIPFVNCSALAPYVHCTHDRVFFFTFYSIQFSNRVIQLFWNILRDENGDNLSTATEKWTEINRAEQVVAIVMPSASNSQSEKNFSLAVYSRIRDTLSNELQWVFALFGCVKYLELGLWKNVDQMQTQMSWDQGKQCLLNAR